MRFQYRIGTKIVQGGAPMKAYSVFADVYDSFMKNIPYGKWCKNITMYLEEHGYTDCGVMELGCGTGSMTIRLAKKGYHMIGTDLSEAMIARAKKRSQRAGVQIRYEQWDMRAKSEVRALPVVLSVCDSMNYLLDEYDLRLTFQSAYHSLMKGGIFLFDMKTDAFYKNLGDATFSDTNEHATYIWENSYDAAERNNNYQLTFFIKNPLGFYTKRTEEHVQHVFSKEEVFRIAKECGFTEISHLDEKLTGPADETAERTYYVLKK